SDLYSIDPLQAFESVPLADGMHDPVDRQDVQLEADLKVAGIGAQSLVAPQDRLRLQAETLGDRRGCIAALHEVLEDSHARPLRRLRVQESGAANCHGGADRSEGREG